MIRVEPRLVIPGFVVLMLSGSAAIAQSIDSDDSKQKKGAAAQAEALVKFGKAAAEYDIRIVGEKKPFQLNKKSILNWTNPARTGENGAIYLWFQRGRPQAIGSIFTYVYQGEVRNKQEFHSLATQKIESSVNGVKIWHPNKPGVEFKPIPKAGAPADSTLRRKTQMKLLARRFSGRMVDGQSGETILNLLSTPLVTYEPKEGPCRYGAIFSLADGTDPEALILIESRLLKNATKPQWQYGIARFHYNELEVFLDRKSVWAVKREVAHEQNLRSTRDLRDEVYVSFKPE